MTTKTTHAADAAQLETMAKEMGITIFTLEYLIARGDIALDDDTAPVEFEEEYCVTGPELILSTHPVPVTLTECINS